MLYSEALNFKNKVIHRFGLYLLNMCVKISEYNLDFI